MQMSKNITNEKGEVTLYQVSYNGISQPVYRRWQIGIDHGYRTVPADEVPASVLNDFRRYLRHAPVTAGEPKWST